MIKTIEACDLTYKEDTTVGITVFELVWWVATVVFGVCPMIAILLD
jgi:hypothetical protein